MEKEIDMLCSKFGGKHMKFHSEREGREEKEMNSNSNGSYEEGGDVMDTQSDSKVTVIKRSRSFDSSMEYKNEQTAGDFYLMMLSGGAGSATDSGFPSAPKSDSGISEHKKVQSFLSESEFSLKLKKSKVSSYRKDLHFVASGIEKKRRISCKACGMIFSNYQALGGHWARHRRSKVIFFSEVLGTKQLNIQNHGSRFSECSICGKRFASDQTLRGHKSLHLVAAQSTASAPAEAVQAFSAAATASMEQISSDFGTLDLNLHDMEDDN